MTLLLLPFMSERIHGYIKYREVWGIGVTLFLFDLIWGVGLSASEVTPGSSQHTALRGVFIMTSAVHGLVFILFFCILSKKVRRQFINLVSNKPKPEQAPTAASNTHIGSDSMESLNGSVAYQRRRMSSGSGSECPTSPGADSVKSYPVHFHLLPPIHETTI